MVKVYETPARRLPRFEPARAHRAQVLLAAPPAAPREPLEALNDAVECTLAETYDDAVRRLDERRFDLILVGYYFDNARPFRLIRSVRAHPHGGRVPIVVLRALQLRMGATTQAEVRAAYQQIGANDFFDYRDEADRLGDEAARRSLREAVLRWLPFGGTAPTGDGE